MSFTPEIATLVFCYTFIHGQKRRMPFAIVLRYLLTKLLLALVQCYFVKTSFRHFEWFLIVMQQIQKKSEVIRK